MTLKFCVIGIGERAKYLLTVMNMVIKDGFKLVAISDESIKALEVARAKYGEDVKYYNNYKDMLKEINKQIDFVFIASRNDRHYNQLLETMKYNLNIFCEKPITNNMKTMIDIYKKSINYNKIITIGYVLRYSAFYRKVKELIPKIGKMITLEANELLIKPHGGYIFTNWRRDFNYSGPMMLEKCCHDMDILNWLVDSVPKKLCSFGDLNIYKKEHFYTEDKLENYLSWGLSWEKGLNPFTTKKNDIHDNDVCIIEYNNDVRAVFHFNGLSRFRERKIFILGTKGCIKGDLYSGDLEIRTDNYNEKMNFDINNFGEGENIMLTELYKIMNGEMKNTIKMDAALYSGLTSLLLDKSCKENIIIDCNKYWKNLNLISKIKNVKSTILPKPLHYAKTTFDFTNYKICNIDSKFNVFLDDYLTIENNGSNTMNIINKIDGNMDEEEYKIIITDVITIFSKSDAGYIYGLVSLIQSLNNNYNVPLIIHDKPTKNAKRIIEIDMARHFYPVKDVKKIIKLMCFLKLNCLHMHLTDDQGWRIEIPKYPKLTKIGSKSNFSQGKLETSQFYTKKDILEIIDYASFRNIEVIPEIDLPGHCTSLLVAYPEYGTQVFELVNVPSDKMVDDFIAENNNLYKKVKKFDKNLNKIVYDSKVVEKTRYEIVKGWPKIAPCILPTKKTRKFLHDVFEYIASIFKSDYIHFGSDEVKGRAMLSNEAIELNNSLGFEEINLKDELGLENYSKNLNMEMYCHKMIREEIMSVGKIPIGWSSPGLVETLKKYPKLIKKSGVFESWLAPKMKGWGFTFDCEDTIPSAIVDCKMKILHTRSDIYYFDIYQDEYEEQWYNKTKDEKYHHLNWSRLFEDKKYITDEMVYNYSTVDYMKKMGIENVADTTFGHCACLWGEHLPTIDSFEKSALPRLLAFSENIWRFDDENYKDYQSYLVRKEMIKKQLEKLNYSFFISPGVLVKC